MSKAIKDDVEAVDKKVEAVHKKVDEISKEVAVSQLSEKHFKIRQWLAGPDPSSNFDRALSKRHSGTGSWLIENEAFRHWDQAQGPSKLIWLYGIPGSGKTILCSTVLEHLLQDYTPLPTVAVVYFFFDFNDSDTQLHMGMMCSLLSQLSMHCISVPFVLETLFSSCMNGGRRPTFKALLETFHQMAMTFERVFIILDALDECKERPELLAGIEEWSSWKDTDVRILATSRREKDIEDSITPLTNDENQICIQSTLVKADIGAYVREQLRTNKRLKRWQKEPKVRLEIETTLVEKADGM